MDEDPFEESPGIEGRADDKECVHVIPIPPGWDVDETIRWISQGLMLPELPEDYAGEEPGWATIHYLDKADCELGHGEG